MESGASTQVRISNNLLRQAEKFLASNPIFGDQRDLVEAALREFIVRRDPKYAEAAARAAGEAATERIIREGLAQRKR